MKKLKYIKLPPKSGYFVGRVYDVPEPLASKHIKAGYAEEQSEPLPQAVPHREKLLSAGVKTAAELNAIAEAGTLTGLSGIGKKTAEEIEAWLTS